MARYLLIKHIKISCFLRDKMFNNFKIKILWKILIKD